MLKATSQVLASTVYLHAATNAPPEYGIAYTRVIFDKHAKLPIASGSVPLTTGPAVRQSM